LKVWGGAHQARATIFATSTGKEKNSNVMKHRRIQNFPDYASLALKKCLISKKCYIQCCHYTV